MGTKRPKNLCHTLLVLSAGDTAGPSEHVQYFLLLVPNIGQFPELTLVHRQTTKG